VRVLGGLVKEDRAIAPPNEAVVEDEPDKSGADSGVLPDSPFDVLHDDALHVHAPAAFLVVVPDLQPLGLCHWHGEQRSLDGNQGTQENHGELHVSCSTRS